MADLDFRRFIHRAVVRGKTMTKTLWILVLLAIAAPFSVPARSQEKSEAKPSIVGTWRLLAVYSWTDKDKKDLNKQAYGPHPKGFITYTADGRMSVIETYDNRKPLSVNDMVRAPAAERAAAYSSVVTYAGTYTLQGDTVIHHQEVQPSPGRNPRGNDQVRIVTFQGPDRVSLRTPPVSRNGVQEFHEMFWERVK
jgi:hypothetical protein